MEYGDISFDYRHNVVVYEYYDEHTTRLQMAITIFGTSNFTTQYWGPDPDTRGAWDLVRSCIITLGLCVYSALHLNVFHHGCPWWARALVRLKWMLVALLAPEFVVFNAWSQRRQACRIARLLRERSGQPDPESVFTTMRNRLGFGKTNNIRNGDEENDILGLDEDGDSVSDVVVPSRTFSWTFTNSPTVSIDPSPSGAIPNHPRLRDRHGRTRGGYDRRRRPGVARVVQHPHHNPRMRRGVSQQRCLPGHLSRLPHPPEHRGPK